MTEVVILIVLTFVNAMLAMAEVAYLSVNKSKVALHAKKGDKKAIKVQKILDNSGTVLATIQIGITFAGFFASAFAADTYADAIVSRLMILNIDLEVLRSIVVVLITVVLSYFNLVLGELFPKNIAIYHPEKITYLMAGTLNVMSKIFYPFVWILTKSTGLLCKIFKIKADSKEKITEEDIKLMIFEGYKEGTIEKDEKSYIYNVFSFNDKKIKEIMIKKENIVALDVDSDTKKILDTIKKSKRSRIPVYYETIDNIIGILNIKDLLVSHANKEMIQLKDILRQPYHVSENDIIDDVFKYMQREQQALLIVHDEHHKVVGLVTLEDIVEEIVGEIYDEYEENSENKKE